MILRAVISLAAALALHSCTASYDSPHTGIRYRVEVPFSAVVPFLLKFEQPVSPQK